MNGIIDFLVGFGELIGSLVNFIITMVKDLIYVIGLLGSLILQLPAMIGWLPSACISLVVVLFSVVVIYKVLGREG